MAEARVGISGWTYPGWRGDFYPDGLAHRKELAYAAGRLTSIEINGSFYSLQRPTSYAKWRDETPEGFVFAVKGGRYITHMKRLVGAETALANFFASGVLALGPKLGPLLWQLPPTLAFDSTSLAAFFDQLPRTTTDAAALASRHDDKLTDDRAWTETDADRPVRHALEVRHPSFDTEEARKLLRAHDVAFVVADTAGRYPYVEAATSDFVYARLHGDKELYASGYTDEALDEWARKLDRWLGEGLDCFAYFDNDMKGYAPFDALRLIERLR
ncbi:DUF72 domain-containing protein [Rhodococcus opacus]|uniref:DUF72 domain-containing protein n=1 Tax=Rhodococcus opacus TaxID=37919 RepID=A0AAX3YAF7_RHOOP|nr:MULTISPECIES: DUF72 domain-containing protein [Rhodococcus]NHU46303.1 DUF72 domain-containing protein [Rhodococcus sp. A14]MCZ4584688.1 DUF72 domain-containing protein [Rhodococcus opacus]MDJ0413569.1 DUF72 domain-containing protein [Rhodococcus opacus]MDV6240483.1 DUF72 domain-containing protein [Rhodococcus opacus]QDQ94682.1 DUF72 domain-containing protein [Rhodococcus sp. WB9]